jgi:hypothetical protein
VALGRGPDSLRRVRWKLVSGVLLALAVAALVVSLVAYHDGSGGLSSHALRRVYEYENAIPLVIQVDDGGVWNDRLWLGIAIGLGASGVAVLGTGRARRRRPSS